MQDNDKTTTPEQPDTFEVVEAEHRTGARHKGVYLLPNLFTTGALFAGFYAIVAAMNGLFEHAAIGIIVAGILDGLDGGVARLTNTQSKFGAEYDSLSDCVAFGVAPGLVAYSWGLSELGKFGWMAAFIYVACAALRLARFNVQAESTDKRFFIGLPSPTGAGLVATLVWLGASRGMDGNDISWLVALVVAGAGLLMVSSVKYHSFKELHIGRVPFKVLLGVIVAFAIVFLDPPLVLLTVAIVYVTVGLLMSLWRLRKGS
ncbi:CDP-diacylglycerol--serine O-phosphatidyltransferase [Alcanivorax jadensis T9]|jgi:CDP-diacylglycerol--serine O-phosphatidyltransferase|uniref:CDP-diacylglycerol--serine O-phosphatidyltransferase n=1 Tax=Alcanivorax jadensis T9 TaxID=1177181 RepID=A0ABR4W9K8_9GAMM|nr:MULTISPECIES: CDP-diacylglycerol--serine O-phosphatidyltransferase [Alcanivorax]KGD60055.1 CDP-diacylglycerol--serine O-phosphatidyltransferase [Alcanivorax jadensis T9]MAC15192.1 CDP-diacylglycerol--serine O-phosphatidyltransferase [Alcanivorax sp.]MBG33797.1 CDP-diacylglycerol--serine O-phosphatidyltransferase [Alcanivorax sp.]MDF1638344.1 CDP-diacylglycerol--serine O-phosphatidyltransferase [Alcanivorax jadensis]|tara:strand:- start:494 stop:1273 length:780 start_codon:yes stop_codon:yes gene_type:complete